MLHAVEWQVLIVKYLKFVGRFVFCWEGMLTRNRPPFRLALAKDIPSHHRGHSVAIWAQGELYLKVWNLKGWRLQFEESLSICSPAPHVISVYQRSLNLDCVTMQIFMKTLEGKLVICRHRLNEQPVLHCSLTRFSETRWAQYCNFHWLEGPEE